MITREKPILSVSAPPTGSEQNMTPQVIDSLRILQEAGGGSLRFEKGVYHFYEDGTEKRFYAVSNNAAGIKSIVFPLHGMDGITVDGGGARFVIHGKIFPFIVDACKNVTLKNMYFDRDRSPHASLRIRDITEDGFGLEIDRRVCPFRVEDGSLILLRELGDFSGKEKVFSLHSAERIRVRYLLTGNCTARHDHLPTAFMWGDAEETPWGIRLTYRDEQDAQPCLYNEGELLSIFPDGGRDNDLIFLKDSEEIRIEDITVRQAMGMGVIAQLCRNITIRGLRTDYDERAGGVTTTADMMHFVNCDGKLDIFDCHITNTEDDILNVHGMYTLLRSSDDTSLRVQIMHHEQEGFCPYREGDRLSLIRQCDGTVLGEFTVTSFAFEENSSQFVRLTGTWDHGQNEVLQCEGKEILVENPDRMPDLHLHHNTFYHFPHLRISGAGELLIEDNHIECAKGGVLLMDLAKYWYESGRIRHLILQRNRLVNCNAMGVACGFIQIGVFGFEDKDAPKVHETVEITDNEFSGIAAYAITAGGVKNLILRGNISNSGAFPVKINGIEP